MQMPIPKPRSDESRDDFIQRCMDDDTMLDEYSDVDQRLAVCLSNLEKATSTEEEKHVRAVRETEDAYIIEFGKHMEEDGYHDDDEDEEDDEKKSESCFECPVELKAMDGEEENKGMFEGYASVFNNADLGNDVILSGAFTKSLKKTGAKGVKLLYQHKADMPIGVFESIEEDKRGLKVRGKLALQTQMGHEAYELMKMGALDGLSIGFRVSPKGQSYDAKGKRRMIKEVELMEISLVTFPMNPKAKIRSVKGDEFTIREWENGLRDVFHLSRSEAKMAAKAVHDAFNQRDADLDADLAAAVKSLTKTLKL
tara:strand:- start:496 stop:1428 length:933 start_codon:yes stop_codon:yes gene_type:complete